MDQHAQPEPPTANLDAESRFRLYPSAKVTLLAEAEFEREYRLMEISRTTLQLAADESLPLNELICVEIPHHLLLADVKSSVRRGDKFAIDAARIVTIRKTATLESAPKSAKIDALMADLHLQCQMQLSTIEASLANLDAKMGKEPRAGIEPDIEKSPLDIDEQFSGYSDEAPEHSEDSSLPPANPSDFGWPPQPCVVTVVALEALEAKAPDQPKINLRTFAEHMTDLGATPRRRGVRRWAIAFGTAAILASLAVLAWAIPLIASSRKAAPVFIAGQVAPSVPAPPAAASEVPNAVAVSHASITSTGVSWISACSDGQYLFQNMLAPGGTREVEFSKMALVRLGNGPAVDIKVDGKPIQPVGVAGVVRAIELSPGGSRFLPVNSLDVAHACGNIPGVPHAAEAAVPNR